MTQRPPFSFVQFLSTTAVAVVGVVCASAFVGLLVSSSGCGGRLARLAAVHGTVTYRGTPVPFGHLVFAPDTERGARGDLAHADLNPDGSYHLVTGEAAGAAVGWHRVTVLAFRLATHDPHNNAVNTLGQLLLPEKYCDPELSGLACEVKPDQDNTIHFNLE